MNIEETINLIQRKIWTAEELLPELEPIKENLDRLTSAQRKRIPIFPNDWSETGVKKYIKEVQAAIAEPIKYANRKKLEAIGLKTEGISEDVLANTKGIDEILAICRDIQEINGIGEELVAESLLTSWVKEGIDNTKANLKEITNAKSAFKRLTESEIDITLKSDLIRKALADATTLSECDETIVKTTYLSEFGIDLIYKGDLEKYSEQIGKVRDLVQQIQHEFGVSKEELIKIMKKKNLSKLVEVLGRQHLEYSKEKISLIEECNLYSYTLSSLGQIVPSLPESLKELRKGAEQLKNRCQELLGESGLALITFFKEGGKFPEEIKIEDVQRTLEILRPFFLKIISKGELNA